MEECQVFSTFTDSEGREVGYLPYDLVSGEESEVLVFKIITLEDVVLKSVFNDDVKLLGRINGTLDAFVDLSDGIPIISGTTVLYDVKALADPAIVGRKRTITWLGLTSMTPAGWEV